MQKISQTLQRLLDEAGSKSDVYKLIVTLVPGGNWQDAVTAVTTAGLQLDREESVIYVLFGSAPGTQIGDIAGLSEVALIEAEGLAIAL